MHYHHKLAIDDYAKEKANSSTNQEQPKGKGKGDKNNWRQQQQQQWNNQWSGQNYQNQNQLQNQNNQNNQWNNQWSGPPPGKGNGGPKGGKKGGKGDANNQQNQWQNQQQSQEQCPPDKVKCKYGPKCWDAKGKGKCNNWHPKDEWKELMKQYQAARIAAKAVANAGGKGGDGGGGQPNAPKQNGGGGNPQSPPQNGQPKPPEVINTIQEVPPKAGPPSKTLRLTAGGHVCAISEELISLSEQFEHFHSNVDRVPNTVEMSDFLMSMTRNLEDKCYAMDATILVPGSSVGERDQRHWRREYLSQKTSEAFGILGDVSIPRRANVCSSSS
eukprot:12411529-Karenia_brevis.AAC.2